MSVEQNEGTILFMKPKKAVVIIALIILLLGGFAVRLIDFTDLPLDSAVTRGLHSFLLARQYYYEMDTPETNALPQDQREFGIKAGQREPSIEPPIMEYLVAYTYRMIGGENMLVPRLYSIFFWIIGGLGLFLLSRKLMPLMGAYAVLAFYLFTSQAAIYSRNFQPDPLMVMLIIWALYFQYRWWQKDTTRNAILAGLFTGLAILVKAPAAFFVGFPMAGLVLQKGFRKSLKNWRVYLIAAFALLPPVIFYALSATVGGNSGSIFGARWFPNLFISPRWYLDWLKLATAMVPVFPFVLALLGFLFFRKKSDRVFYFCMWLGYVLYGYMFAYHIYTHSYYHLPLIPIAALGFGAVINALYEKIAESPKNWLSQAVVIVLILFSLALAVQRIRGVLVAKDYRHEAQYWADLADELGHNTSVIALTHDYGYRLSYWGFINAEIWPTEGDQTVKELQGSTDPAFKQYFDLKTENMNYFLVTLLNEFENQPELRDYLFAHYPYKEGDGYYIFDLMNPLN
ncbi:MAG: glycosyltransferase family 39 protein [Anaerolineaceae bacterium]|nr:glycosyltransferase family 39 protein [Anaerolineaceae bacterium]